MRALDPKTIHSASPRMQQWLNDPELIEKLTTLTLADELREVLSRPIHTEDDLVLIENTYSGDTLNTWRTMGLPPNQIESLCSHTHIEDWVEGSRESLLLQGLALALTLQDRLAPYGEFLIYVLVSHSTSTDTTCTVQFHQKRSGDTLWGENPTWEILILET